MRKHFKSGATGKLDARHKFLVKLFTYKPIPQAKLIVFDLNFLNVSLCVGIAFITHFVSQIIPENKPVPLKK